MTRWLDKSGQPIPGIPKLPVEKATEIKIFSKKDQMHWICATFKPCSKGTLLYEHEEPLIARQNGADHTRRDADAGWFVGGRGDSR